MKSLTTKSFKASQFTGRNQLLQKTRLLTSLTFSSRALSFGLLRFSNDRPRKVQATKPDLVRLSPPLFSNQRKNPREGSDHNKANESPLQKESDSISIEKALLYIKKKLLYVPMKDNNGAPVIAWLMAGLYNTGELEEPDTPVGLWVKGPNFWYLEVHANFG